MFFNVAPTHVDIIGFKTSRCNLKIRGLGANYVCFFYYFNFEKTYEVLKSKSPCILSNKNINFDKNETESKMENPTHTVFDRGILCFSSYKNRKLKVKV